MSARYPDPADPQYGAAAQEYFGYKTEALANAWLTEDEQAYASSSVSMENLRLPSASYYGTSLSLEENIVLNFYFKGDLIGKTATVTYVDHYGKAHSYTVTAAQSGSYARVTVDQLVVADASVPVTVTIGSERVEDSIESYCARMLTQLPLCEPLMKFASSARSYFASN